MHEYSVVAALLETCMQHLESNNATAITAIKISIGQRANIDKTLLESAFDVLKADFEALSNAKIDIITKKLMLTCKDCGGEFHNLSNPTCPFCNGKNTQITQGRDILLESLELEIKEKK